MDAVRDHLLIYVCHLHGDRALRPFLAVDIHLDGAL